MNEDLVIKYRNLAIELARIIQRLELEGVDLSVDDIKTVWSLKTLLGEATPVSVEEGTGSMIGRSDINEQRI